jgi:hypothetical protein
MRASLLAILVLSGPIASCVHVPPDPEARIAFRSPEAQRRVPAATEVPGAWISEENRGLLSDFGPWVVYVFDEAGAYTGAFVSPAECVPVGGTWTFDKGILDLDAGVLRFEASMVGNRLELLHPEGFLSLRRLREGEEKSPELAAEPSGS